MAKLFPTQENINALRVKPTEGEAALLAFLMQTLDDNYEIYFQPYLNGDNPDVIIMREKSGVMIIEVKDWDLNNYELNQQKNWVLKNVTDPLGRKQIVKSPIRQVFEYKENLYNLHIDSLLEKRIKNPKYLSIVNCCVYFHKATKRRIDELLTDGFSQDVNYLKFLSYFDLFGFDNLSAENFRLAITKRWLDRQSFLFDDELYKSFRRYLQPPAHTLEQGINIAYTSEQERIIESRANVQQKVKGVVGSGKTLTLAKRAVNAHIRHREKVLILTFNISLRNYIHDRINEVRENFDWKYFEIIHYHQFIRSHNNNINYVGEDDNSTRADGLSFKTIIIDEIQDYEKQWILNVRGFLEADGEFVVFGDEKQNIYQRDLEEKKPYTGIGGAWNLLKRSFRVTVDIALLASEFQRRFFVERYDYDEIIVQRDMFDSSAIKYYHLPESDLGSLMQIYRQEVKLLNVHDNDVCILCSKVEMLRGIDKEIRDSFHKRTKTMFETQEIYDTLVERFTVDGELQKTKLKKEIEHIRRGKKFHFWMNTGTTKLSTTHSMKGWEIPTLFFIIESADDTESEFTTEELIYTAFTRCRQNLIIINMANDRYHDFFTGLPLIEKMTL
jgi:hypothetical protein